MTENYYFQCNERILYLAKISFKYEEKKDMFGKKGHVQENKK